MRFSAVLSAFSSDRSDQGGGGEGFVARTTRSEVNALRILAADVATAIEGLAAFDIIARSGPVPELSTPAL